jgi:hypothetical protein
MSATEGEVNGDAVTYFEMGNSRTYLYDLTTGLVARHDLSFTRAIATDNGVSARVKTHVTSADS